MTATGGRGGREENWLAAVQFVCQGLGGLGRGALSSDREQHVQRLQVREHGSLAMDAFHY